MSKPAYTISQYMKRLRISRDRLKGFIDSGELEAIDVSGPNAPYPQYRITHEAAERFELARTKKAAPKTPSRRKPKQSGVTEYF